MHRPRKEMIAETRAKLIAAARQAFGTIGYAEASMDDFTASAGLTRGALYHHFGDKKGLLQAVIAEIDGEMAARCQRGRGAGADPLAGLRRRMHRLYRDGAGAGNPAHHVPRRSGRARRSRTVAERQCAASASMTDHLTRLQEEGWSSPTSTPKTAARLINGASSQASQRIANAEDPEATSKKVVAAFKQLLEGLLKKADGPAGQRR